MKAACQRAGISRRHFYEIKEAYEKHGAEGLEPKERRRPRMPNQTPPELEKQILDMTHRCLRAGRSWPVGSPRHHVAPAAPAVARQEDGQRRRRAHRTGQASAADACWP
ncbi:MAG: helix-turn-helix domain-containing protein [Acidobacteriota bacterium]